MNSWNIPEKDRITLAWELRRDIHAWLMAKSRATMPEIFDAFSEINHETVRKAVYRMRTDGDVALIARNRICNAGVYAAITPRIKSEEAKRQALAKGALKMREKAAAAPREKPAKKPQPKKETAQKHADPVWLTRNTRFDDPLARPYKNQGGQGVSSPRMICTMLG
jgi:hypothetical protein